MKKVGITILVIIVVIIIALVVAPAFIDVNSFHGRIQAELEQRLGRQVTLGQLHLRLLPPEFSADNVSVADDPSFQLQRPFAQAQQLTVHVALWPLLSKQVEISSLNLTRPDVELVRNPQGVWNFSTLGTQPTSKTGQQPAQPSPAGKPNQAKNAPQPAGTNQPAKGSASSPGGNFALNDLVISDGSVAITDEQKRQPRQVYDHIDLELQHFAPGQAFELSAAAHLPGPGEQVVKLDGAAGPLDSATLANTPADMKVNLQHVSISGVERFLNSPALAGDDAVITGQATIKNAAQSFSSSGDLKLDQVKLRGHELGYPITANYAVSNSGKELRIDRGDLRLGATPIAISGTLNSQATPAQVDLRLKASNVSIQEIARLAADAGVAFNPNMNIAGRFSADISAQGPMTLPALTGNVSANNLEISGKGLPQPVRVNAIQLAMTPSQIRSNDFSASTGATALNLQFTLTNYTSKAPAVDAAVRTTNANLGEFLDIAKAYGVQALTGVEGSGRLSLNAHASGPIRNPAGMTFSGNGQLANAQVKSPSLGAPLLVKNANLGFSQNAADISNLEASLGSTHATGSMTLKDFLNPEVQFTLAADKVDAGEMGRIFGAADSGASNSGGAANAAAEPQTKSARWALIPRAYAAAGKSGEPGLLERTTGRGTLSAGSILYQGLQLTNVHSLVTLNRGLITLSPLTAQLYGGQENGAINIDARSTPMTYTVNAKLGHVDANQLLSATTKLKQTLYGLLNLDANTSFSSGNGDLARSLNGTAALNLVNGRLEHMDLLKELGSIGKFIRPAGATNSSGSTSIAKLGGNFNITNGVAQTNNLQAAIEGGTLAGAGDINLATEALNMRVTAVLDKAMTQSIGGTGIGGFMSTALANNKGELVMPVLVTGTMSAPRFAPDVAAIAKMKLQNLLPTSSNPGDLTSGLLGALTGKNPNGKQNVVQGLLQQLSGKNQQNAPQPAQNSAQQQATGWQGLLNGILNNKKKQQQAPQKPQQTPPQ